MRHLRDQLQTSSGQPPGSLSQPRLRSAGLAYFSACMLRSYEPRPTAEGQKSKGGTFLTLSDWQHKGFSYHKGDLWLLSCTPDFKVQRGLTRCHSRSIICMLLALECSCGIWHIGTWLHGLRCRGRAHVIILHVVVQHARAQGLSTAVSHSICEWTWAA